MTLFTLFQHMISHMQNDLYVQDLQDAACVPFFLWKDCYLFLLKCHFNVNGLCISSQKYITVTLCQ